MQRTFVLFVFLGAACGGKAGPTRPELGSTECYAAQALPQIRGDRPLHCAFQDQLPAEVSHLVAMARLRIECDPEKVMAAVSFNHHLPEEEPKFIEVACNDDYPTELVCGWTTNFRITAHDFGEGTTRVIIRSDCPLPEYGGVRCSDQIPPHAIFTSTERHCETGDALLINPVSSNQEITVWADPID
ncbi:hypothetical protein HYW17_03125 [Candidatus Uhrbacteria bacterium]|nr:hypothetical protein [Candidatus Uhrbacteria bacterium]